MALLAEYMQSGRATEKTDVYSFGVLVLEVLSGKRPTDASFIEKGLNIVGWVCLFTILQKYSFFKTVTGITFLLRRSETSYLAMTVRVYTFANLMSLQSYTHTCIYIYVFSIDSFYYYAANICYVPLWPLKPSSGMFHKAG